ncbi:MAG: hypothetical protein KC657_30300 [Myxococcales bacterium]|nr:hypothetical protein [Myxococcales bacterium]
MSAWPYAIGGAALGATHAALIARAARRQAHALSGVARLALVGAALWLAARSGHLVAAAIAWAIAYAAAIALVRRGMR